MNNAPNNPAHYPSAHHFQHPMSHLAHTRYALYSGGVPPHRAAAMPGGVPSPPPRVLGLRAVPAMDTQDMVHDLVEPKELTALMFATMMSSEQIKVVVGLGQYAKTFNLPKDLLTWVSPYFKAHLNNKWNVDGKVFLEDDTAAGFVLAISLICRPGYHLVPEFKDEADTPFEFITSLIELASLGQSLIVPMLVHAALLNFLNISIDGNVWENLAPEHVELAIAKLEAKSSMRRAITAAVAREYIKNVSQDNKDIEEGWKFAGVMLNHRGDGFAGELLMAVNDVHKGRNQIALRVWDNMAG